MEGRPETGGLRVGPGLIELLDALDIGVVVQGPTGEIVVANEAASALLGLSLDQLLGRTSTDPRWRAVTPEGRPLPGDQHPAMVTLREGRPILGFLMGVEVPDVGTRWLSVSTRSLSGPGGADGVVALFRDVTDSPRADDALRTWERRYRLATELSPAGVAIFDRQGHAIRANPAFERLLGVTEADLQARPWWELVDLVDEDEVRQLLRALSRGAIRTFESDIELRTESGPRILRAHARVLPASDSAGWEVAAVVEDVTRDVLARRALERRVELDPLTGVLNFGAVAQRLEALRTGPPAAVLFIDVDDFKGVNDRYGHALGDDVLVRTAALLRSQVRASDAVGRLGGDEFVVLLADVPEADYARGVARRIVAACALDAPVRVTVSAGLAFATPGVAPEEVLRRADRAMYAAKQAGRNQLQEWHEDGVGREP